MSKSVLGLITLVLLTLAALATMLCTLALFLLAWLSGWPPLTQHFILFTAIVLLVSGGASAVAGSWLLAARRAHRTTADGSPPARQISRRDFLRFAAVETALAGAAVAATGYATRIEPHRVQVEEVDVPIADLPPQLDGLRIVQLSDLHYSRVVPLAHIRRAVAMAQELAGDLIVITGDHVTDSASDAFACAQALAELHAPLGVYAILGNHDHWTNADTVAQALTAAGLTLLRNQGQPIARDGGDRADLWLAGLDDVWERQENLDAALRDAPAGLPVLLLVHEPDYADRVSDRRIILQLSGHSHGGQVRLPFVGAPLLPYLGQKYSWGLQRAGQMWVYTSRGVGMVRPAVRFNCPPEVTALTLRRGAPAA